MAGPAGWSDDLPGDTVNDTKTDVGLADRHDLIDRPGQSHRMRSSPLIPTYDLGRRDPVRQRSLVSAANYAHAGPARPGGRPISTPGAPPASGTTPSSGYRTILLGI